MRFWKYLFGGKSKSLEEEVPSEFKNWLKLSIQLMGQEGMKLEEEALHAFLVSKGIPSFDATEIIVFLPSICCKMIFPDLNWLTEYYDCYPDSRKIKRRYRDNYRYVIMEKEVSKYWKLEEEKHKIVNIALRSAELGAINQMLKDGGKLENARFSETCIFRKE